MQSKIVSTKRDVLKINPTNLQETSNQSKGWNGRQKIFLKHQICESNGDYSKIVCQMLHWHTVRYYVPKKTSKEAFLSFQKKMWRLCKYISVQHVVRENFLYNL